MSKTTIEDIACIKCLNHLALNASGSKAVFTVISPQLEKNKENNDFFLLDMKNDEVHQLTFNGKNSDFIWDDDHTLLFPSVREEEDESKPYEVKTTFYRLDIDGGEAKKAFVIDQNVIHIEKIEEGLYALLAVVDRNQVDVKVVGKEKAEESLDYHIFEEAPFWGNGRGYISGKRSVLFLYDEKKDQLKQITDQYTNVSQFKLSGHKIIYTSSSWTDVMPLTKELHVYDVDQENDQIIVPAGKLYIADLAVEKDTVVFTASDMKKWGTGQLKDFWQADLNSGAYEEIRHNVEGFAISDVPLADTIRKAGNDFKIVDGTLYFTAMHEGITDVYSLKDKDIEKVIDANKGVVITFDTVDGKDFVSVQADEDALAVVKHNGKTVFDPNEGLMKGKWVSKVHELSFVNRKGETVDGFYLEPYGFDPQKKYPAVLEIHGGPRCAYGHTYMHEMQVFAAKGMFVLFANPHGSESYGEEFADIRGKYGTVDYEDLMDFVDEALKEIPQIDAKKLGACGGSYGGFMCNWIEGHTDRFAAIASQRSVSNWVADFGASEIGVSFDSNEMAATPWTDMEKMWDQSPLKYADHAKTPILFIHSLCDYNCTIDQGVEMFTAMRYFHVPSKMVVFEGENHSLSRNGKPKHRVRRLEEISGWFEKYLMGENV